MILENKCLIGVKNMTYAYARVSAQDQNLTRQIEAFNKYGVEKNNIFCDKKSGKNFERANYKMLIENLKKNDLLVIKSIDRLGRNYDQIISEWNKITNIIGANILVLDMPLLDTRTKSDTLVGKFISDVVLQILSFVAENERMNIRARQAEGIKVAKAQGIQFGRPQTDYSRKFQNIAQKYLNNGIELRDALNALNMKKSTFYYHLRKLN